VSRLPARGWTRALRWGVQLVLAVAGLILGASAAFAYWTASAGGVAAGALADTLPAGGTPAVSVLGASTTPTVSFAASTTSASSGGQQITTYQVRRYTNPAAAAGTGTLVTCGSSSIAGGTVTCTDPGLADGSYYYTSTPRVANWTGTESVKSPAGVVDTLPPAVSAGRTAPNANGWNAGDVVVNLSATDTGTGVASITYSLDGGAAVTTPGATASLAITAEGAHSVSYSAADNRGNTSTTLSLTGIKIDKTAPTGMTGSGTETCTGGTSGSFCGGGITLGLAAGSDAGSGLASVTYAIDGGSALSISTSATSLLIPSTVADGTHTVAFVTTDLAGNATTRTYTTSKSTDNTRPTATITLSATSPNKQLDINDRLVVTFTEAGSGIDITKFCPNWTGGTVTGSVNVSSASSSLLTVAGNSAASGCAANAFTLGTVNLGAAYIKNQAQTVNATFAWSAATKTLTVTVTSNPSNGQQQTVPSSTPGWTTTPSGLDDLVGNLIGTVTGVSGAV